MMGPGQYDDQATLVREAMKAHGVILMVIGGTRGDGFSVQAAPYVLPFLPTMLRSMADQIETDVRAEMERLKL